MKKKPLLVMFLSQAFEEDGGRHRQGPRCACFLCPIRPFLFLLGFG